MILLKDAVIVTSEREGKGSVLIDGDTIRDIFWADSQDYAARIGFCIERNPGMDVEDLEGKHLIAGGIDAHVHFREPGLTHKAEISTESRAAAAGGVTTVMDMPNTIPATINAEALAEKKRIAEGKSAVRIHFHIGATNENADRIMELVGKGDAASGLAPEDIAGVKVFMGSSTGNMLVDEGNSLERLFSIKDKPVLVHCEDEKTIRENLSKAIAEYGEDIPFREHETIRSRSACIKSSIRALELAIAHSTRLTLCHISTKEEIEMVRAAKLSNPHICAETSCNYLWFSNEDYPRLGSRLKCNPSVKGASDRKALREALKNGLIDTIGSDHAPHLLSEKDAPYTKAPSGLPSIQQTLPVLLTIAFQEDIPLTRIAAVFSENASRIYNLNCGRIEKGLLADLVVFDYSGETEVRDEDQLSKCGWTPYSGERLRGHIEKVFIGGKPAFENNQ